MRELIAELSKAEQSGAKRSKAEMNKVKRRSMYTDYYKRCRTQAGAKALPLIGQKLSLAGEEMKLVLCSLAIDLPLFENALSSLGLRVMAWREYCSQSGTTVYPIKTLT